MSIYRTPQNSTTVISEVPPLDLLCTTGSVTRSAEAPRCRTSSSKRSHTQTGCACRRVVEISSFTVSSIGMRDNTMMRRADGGAEFVLSVL